MPLRVDLEPRKPDEQVLNRLEQLAVQIEDGLQANQDMAADIAEFNRLTGRETDPKEFLMYSGATTLESFVIESCVIHSKPTPGIERGDLIDIVRRLQEAEGEDWEQTYYLSVLQSNVTDPEVSDLIFWSDDDLSAAEIVDRAMSYQVQPMPARREYEP